MNRYKITTDKNGYVLSIQKSEEGIELDVSKLDMSFLYCYKLTGNSLIMDESKKDSIIETDEKEKRIAELRRMLTESDDIMGGFLDDMASLNNPVTFIADFIKLIGNINTKYAQLIIDRKAWREELESLLK